MSLTEEMTASEPLSLEEEYAMQLSWRDDPKKCTFIIMGRGEAGWLTVLMLYCAHPFCQVRVYQGSLCCQRNLCVYVEAVTGISLAFPFSPGTRWTDVGVETRQSECTSEEDGSKETAMAGDVNIFFNDFEDPGMCEVEVMVAEESWRRRGLAREAVLMLMRYGAHATQSLSTLYCRFPPSDELQVIL